MEIAEAIEEYLLVKRPAITEDTAAWYGIFLHQFLLWCHDHALTDLSALSAAHVQTFVQDCPTPSTRTRHHRAQVVKGFLHWCSEDAEMGVHEKMVRRIEMPKVEQSEITILSDTDIAALFRACTNTRNPHRNRALLSLLLDTGLRASEICVDTGRRKEETGLRMEHMILAREDSLIRIIAKGRRVRTVGFGAQTALLIRRYLARERGRSENPYVFLARGDRPLSVRMLQQLLGELGTRAGVEHVHPHRFRHTFAVHQLLQGTSAFVLMNLMGHTHIESTQPYLRALSDIQIRKQASSVVDTLHTRKTV